LKPHVSPHKLLATVLFHIEFEKIASRALLLVLRIPTIARTKIDSMATVPSNDCRCHLRLFARPTRVVG